jgi:serine protease Do
MNRKSTAASIISAATILGAFTGAAAAYADGAQYRPADLDKSIVWVDVTWEATVTVPFTDGTTEKKRASADFFCTGWFASTTGDIATAGHCVTKDDDLRITLLQNLIDDNDYGLKATKVDWDVVIDAPTVHVGQPTGVPGGPFTGGLPLVAQVVAAQPFDDGDNALLRVADLQNTPALELADGIPETGESITSIGFPGSVMTVADVQRQHPSHKNGTVSSRQYSKHGVPSTEIDAAVSGGMSGGPTVDDQGHVIGINSFKINGESQPFNFVTDAKSLHDFLNANGVVVTQGASAGQNGAAQTGTTQAGTAQAGTAQAGTAQAGTAQGGTAQSGTAAAGSASAQGQAGGSSVATSPTPAAGSQGTTPSTGGGLPLTGILAAAALLGLVGTGGSAYALKRRLDAIRRQPSPQA